MNTQSRNLNSTGGESATPRGFLVAALQHLHCWGDVPPLITTKLISSGRFRTRLLAVALIVALASSVAAQPFGGRGFGGGGFGGGGFGGGGRRADPLQFDRSEFPSWKIDESFSGDLFTFVRIKTTPTWNRSSNRDWLADYPDADFYFSWRLHQLTSLAVNPDPIYLELTDSGLCDYPFVFLAAPQSVDFTPEETTALRNYLLNGGFMMCDEFFGTIQWDLFYRQLKKVFPEFEPVELSLSHEIFNNVYKFDRFPQVTAIHFWQRWGITHHPVPGTEVDHKPHFFGLHDRGGRMMMLICHNNDIQDGWEREREDREFFEEFSVKQSYPLGINIVTYALTH